MRAIHFSHDNGGVDGLDAVGGTTDERRTGVNRGQRVVAAGYLDGLAVDGDT